MVGQLGQVRLQVGAVRPLHRLSYLAVETHAAGRVQLPVERLADEGVGELVGAGAAIPALSDH